MSNVVISTQNLQKPFTVKKQVVKAVDGVDLEVKSGEILGFLGPNGCAGYLAYPFQKLGNK